MTIKLYHTTSYQKTFDAEVTAQDQENHGVVLSQTAFFPGGGGQPADKGTFAGQSKDYQSQIGPCPSRIIPTPGNWRLGYR